MKLYSRLYQHLYKSYDNSEQLLPVLPFKKIKSLISGAQDRLIVQTNRTD